MEAQVEPMDSIELPMNGSLEIEEDGRYCSVSLHSKKKLAMSIQEAPYGKEIFYSVFETAGRKLSLRHNDYNEQGKHPSAALVYDEQNDKTFAIAIHRSKYVKDIYIKTGSVDEKRKEIHWGTAQLLDRGVKPKICASKNGTIAIVFEETYTFKGLKYRVGTVTYNSQDQPPTIDWKDAKGGLEIPKFKGVEPDIAITDTTAVVICRSDVSTLKTIVGAIRSDKTIDWGQPQRLEGTPGINPAITINSHGYAVEIHQTKLFRGLTRNHGQIFPSKTIDWG